MQVIKSIRGMQSTSKRLIEDGRSIRLVPTMGALHDGHSLLIKRAIEDNAHEDDEGDVDVARTAINDRNPVVVVSIFANPIQFNDRNDFVNYPNTIESDLELCKKLRVDYVFVPKCEDIYPAIQSSCDRKKQSVTTRGRCIVKPPEELANILEGKSRKGHFEGMLTIVCKLFNIIQPDRAYFGLKDYQQLVLVTKMTEDLNLPVKVCAVETVREVETNLPLSSRNVRLNLEQRRLAAQMMFDTLVSTKKCLEERCRRGNHLRSDCSNSDELSSILLASMMTSQLCLNLSDNNDDMTDYHMSRNSNQSKKLDCITVDYFELRCAKDLTMINYDQNLAIYDCQRGCIKYRSLPEADDVDGNNTSKVDAILEARLLISILLSNVRLLDNIEVQMNL